MLRFFIESLVIALIGLTIGATGMFLLWKFFSLFC